MATIASLLQSRENQECYEFLVEEIFYPTIDSPNIQIICNISGTNASLYDQTYLYLKENILPQNLSRNQKRNFIW